MTKNKKYYWLKLFDNDFSDINFIQIRKLPGGDALTIIYLKMMLIAIKNECYIVQNDTTIPVNEELALIMNEDKDAVLMLIKFLQTKNLFNEIEEGKFYLPNVEKRIGSETDAAQRVRKYREKLKEEKDKALQCNTGVTTCYAPVTTCYVEKRREELDSTNNTKDNTPLGTEGFTYLNKNIAVAENVDNFQLLDKISYLLEELKVDKSEWNKILTFPEDHIRKYAAAVKERIKQNKCENPAGLFLYLLYNNKDIPIKFEEVQQKEELQLYKKKASKFCSSCTEWEKKDIFCTHDGMRLDKNTLSNVKCEFCKVEK